MKQVQIFHDICTPRDRFNRFRLVPFSLLTVRKIQNQCKARISKKETLDDDSQYRCTF